LVIFSVGKVMVFSTFSPRCWIAFLEIAMRRRAG
jgi:hypothetical protein